jgi:hypothetical protein
MSEVKKSIEDSIASTEKALDDLFYTYEINGVKYKVFRRIPYKSCRKMVAMLINTGYELGAKISIEMIETIMDSILIAVVKEPKLKKEDLESDALPNDLAGLAIMHFGQVVVMYKAVTSPLTSIEEQKEKEEKESDSGKVFVEGILKEQ